VMVVGAQSAACNARHDLKQRFCRWVLMSCDGVGSDEVSLTQEYLSVMLGVRRAGVTVAAGQLQEEGLIGYERGSIRIRNREALERTSCECYQRAKEEYQRLFNE
jgi:CRP-like cAMP-binding protein